MQTAMCKLQYANCNILLEYANCHISLRFNSTFGFRFRFKFKQTAICRLQCGNCNMRTVICKLKKYRQPEKWRWPQKWGKSEKLKTSSEMKMTSMMKDVQYSVILFLLLPFHILDAVQYSICHKPHLAITTRQLSFS